ncbi:MAG: hypothetical protein J1F11_13515 [Oscillospiraceae bacterium]|nr:hypothetical protein [Oscillospiraceae bacterium]
MMIGGVSGNNTNKDFYSKFRNNNRTGSGIEFTLPDWLREGMTLDQYKLYIDDRISRMSDLDSLLADISDEGYMAMKNDPEYEKAVLDKIQAEIDRMEQAGKNAPSTVIRIGASEEENRIERNTDVERTKTQNVDEDWWDERMEKMRENIRLNAAIRQKRELEQKEIARKLIFAERLNSAVRQEKILKGEDPNEADINKTDIYAKASMSANITGLIVSSFSL